MKEIKPNFRKLYSVQFFISFFSLTDYDFSIFPEIDYVSLSSKSVFLLLLVLIDILKLFKLLFFY